MPTTTTPFAARAAVPKLTAPAMHALRCGKNISCTTPELVCDYLRGIKTFDPSGNVIALI